MRRGGRDNEKIYLSKADISVLVISILSPKSIIEVFSPGNFFIEF